MLSDNANGKETKAYDFTCDQKGESVSDGNTDFLVEGSRVMLYGGSTVHWGGWCLRYKPEDFKLYSNTGLGGDWPFEYDEMFPYYEQAEHHLTVCGDINESWNQEMRPHVPYPRPAFRWTAPDGEMIQAWEKNGIEPGKMPMARYRKCMTTGTCKYCPIGARFSGQLILDELKADTRNINFEIRTSSPATQVLVDSKSRIKGVEYLDSKSGETKQVYAGTVIVCSGAYESPKLLMLSRSRYWENGIGNDHDLLGRYLVSHSIIKVRGELDHNEECWFQEYDFPTLMSRTYDTEAKQKNNKIFLFKNRALPNIDFGQLMIDGNSRAEIRVTEQTRNSAKNELTGKFRVEHVYSGEEQKTVTEMFRRMYSFPGEFDPYFYLLESRKIYNAAVKTGFLSAARLARRRLHSRITGQPVNARREQALQGYQGRRLCSGAQRARAGTDQVRTGDRWNLSTHLRTIEHGRR